VRRGAAHRCFPQTRPLSVGSRGVRNPFALQLRGPECGG
jgi:hypothetical protein